MESASCLQLCGDVAVDPDEEQIMASVHIVVLAQTPATVSHLFTFQSPLPSMGWGRESEQGETHRLRSERFNN